MNENRFYVYVHLDPRKPGRYSYEGVPVSFLYEPYYIGKGIGNRYLRHFRKSEILKGINIEKNNIIKRIIAETGDNPYAMIVVDNLYNDKAYDIEIDFILKIGKHINNEGPLTNILDGGDGRSFGFKYSEESKKKSSEALKKYYRENPYSEEAKKNLSESLKKYYRETPEAKKKNSEALKKYYNENPVSEESKKKKSESLKKHYSENPVSEEAKKNLSESLKKHYSENPEAKKNLSELKKKYYRENPVSEEDKKKMSYANPSSLSIIIDNTYYNSINMAVKSLRISHKTIKKRIESKNVSNYRYATEEEIQEYRRNN
ncbi:MAG: hypothetical protein KAS32_16685 [Candidatus Peribacteraceae bacterium]|nr:hypothetical protein [Candidatus Peribacteraceae bacterium]